MAGGSGTRFWPLSRARTPKHVLNIIGQNSLLQDTVHRLNGLVPPENTYIVTNQKQAAVISNQLNHLPERNFICEPTPRNTAPCIGLAAIHLRRMDPDAIMIVMPSDHLITEVEAFRHTINLAIEVVYKYNPLVTIGIPPTRPETGYGYIQIDAVKGDLTDEVFRVKAFAEKPNQTTAKRFLESGDFFWNSGIFIWRASRILEEMEEHLPDEYHQLEIIEKAIGTPKYKSELANRYKRLRSISIDYGIMEKSHSPIYMLSSGFHWSDVGSWDELYRISTKGRDGNVTIGESVQIDMDNSFIYSPAKLTAVIGMKNILVVNTGTATLICPLERAQDVKLVVDKLKQEKRNRYL